MPEAEIIKFSKQDIVTASAMNPYDPYVNNQLDAPTTSGDGWQDPWN